MSNGNKDRHLCATVISGAWGDSMRTGDRVKDFDGRPGTIEIGRFTGAVSIVWDHEPDTNEHYVEWEYVSPLEDSDE
jgi:hypothetical protein